MGNKVYFISNRNIDSSEPMNKWIHIDDRLHIGEAKIEEYFNTHRIEKDSLKFYIGNDSQKLDKLFDQTSNNVLLYFHGFNRDFQDSLCDIHKIKKRFKLVDESYNSDVIVFSWASNGKLNAVDYLLDQEDAKLSNLAVDYMFKYFENISKRINLLCHSMGNYVLSNGWQEYKNNNFKKIFKNIVLVEADEDNDCFEKSTKLKGINEITDRVSVFYNDRDWVLDYSDHAILKNLPRLGKTGPIKKQGLPENIKLFDVTGRVKENQHGYLTEGDNGEVLKIIINLLKS
jgi:esterase/lipase superfamily enzyme